MKALTTKLKRVEEKFFFSSTRGREGERERRWEGGKVPNEINFNFPLVIKKGNNSLYRDRQAGENVLNRMS